MTTLFSSLWRGTEQQISRILDKVDDQLHNSIKPECAQWVSCSCILANRNFPLLKHYLEQKFRPLRHKLWAELKPCWRGKALRTEGFVRKSCETLTLSIAKCPDDAWNKPVWRHRGRWEMPRNAVMGFAMNHTMQHIGAKSFGAEIQVE